MFGKATIRLGIGPHSSFNCLIGTEGLSKVTAPRRIVVTVIMVALCNRADHYIFALWLLSFYLSFF